MRVVLLGLVLLLAACTDRGAAPPPNLPPAPTYSVFFEPDSTSLTKDAKRVLGEVATQIRATRPSTVVVEGYTSKPGGPAKNQQVSRERVDAVVKALAETGLAPSEMLKIAKGEKTVGLDPVGDRRVDITLQSAR
ncbi:MAG: OmpA family protein [Rhodospirillales bacterium]|nr:OmpA family protein [Rhodospirillales bacterium]